MRLWTVHPRYLDRKGLLAVWREGLLAQKVLQGKTTGYRNHPQLRRFSTSPAPLGAIATYLHTIGEEGLRRGYRFDRDKILQIKFGGQIACTGGQLLYEWERLCQKVSQRDPDWYQGIKRVKEPEPHPLFRIVEGDIEDWEIGAPRPV